MCSFSSGECTPRIVGPNDTISKYGYFSKNNPHSNPACIALIAGFVLLNETMTAREIIGSILIFGSVVCSQKPFEIFFKKKDI